MRVLLWGSRIFIFLFLLAFALKNTDPVSIRFLLDTAWQAPLIIIVLAFFAGGAALGVLSLLGTVFAQRREISRLQREANQPHNDDNRQPVADETMTITSDGEPGPQVAAIR